MKVEGYIKFENSLPLKGNSLNKEFQIKVLNIIGSLVTPRLAPDFNIKKENEFAPQLLKPEGSSPRLAKVNWGSVGMLPDGDSYVNCCYLYFQIESEVAREIGADLSQAIESWRKLFIENLSVISKMDLRGPEKDGPYSGSHGSHYLFADIQNSTGKFDSERFYHPQTITLYSPVIGKNAVSSDQISTSIQLANEHKRPVLEFYLLLDSQRELVEDNFRKVVLDAATALEVCFIKLISANLNIDDALKNLLLEKHNSLFQKRQLLKVLKIDLPRLPQEYQDFEKLRNKAIHAGTLPTEKEAIWAFGLAQESLYQLAINKFE